MANRPFRIFWLFTVLGLVGCGARVSATQPDMTQNSGDTGPHAVATAQTATATLAGGIQVVTQQGFPAGLQATGAKPAGNCPASSAYWLQPSRVYIVTCDPMRGLSAATWGQQSLTVTTSYVPEFTVPVAAVGVLMTHTVSVPSSIDTHKPISVKLDDSNITLPPPE